MTDPTHVYTPAQRALFALIYDIAYADGAVEPRAPLSAEQAALIDMVRADRWDAVARGCAGYLPFDDSHELRVAPAWLLKAQEGTAER